MEADGEGRKGVENLELPCLRFPIQLLERRVGKPFGNIVARMEQQPPPALDVTDRIGHGDARPPEPQRIVIGTSGFGRPEKRIDPAVQAQRYGETLDDKLLARHPLAPKRIAVVAQYLPANALRRQFPHPRSQTAVFFRQDDFHSFFVFFL